MSSSPVWFLLLDSATGQPYKGTTADFVSLASSAFIAQFRDAVIEKFDKQKSSVLTGFASSQLIVYKNKAAFGKRNDPNDPDGKPLDPTQSLGLLGSQEDMLVVVVPSSTSSPELDRLDQEIKALENSDEYQTLKKRNGAWAVPKPTEQEQSEWQLLKEKLDDLKKEQDFHRKAILSTNAHSVKKSDKTRKGYKKDTAIKDERLLLSDVAITMWERFGFTLQRKGKPTFGDLMRATGFKDDGDVRDYFRKKTIGEVEGDGIKESFTKEEWIWLIDLNQHVNPLLHEKLTANQDGSLRLVLEQHVYRDRAGMAENVVRTLYGPQQKVDIKDAASDSSNSSNSP
jgi:hypothetical protein